jgi:hypothetical protein
MMTNSLARWHKRSDIKLDSRFWRYVPSRESDPVGLKVSLSFLKIVKVIQRLKRFSRLCFF